VSKNEDTSSNGNLCPDSGQIGRSFEPAIRKRGTSKSLPLSRVAVRSEFSSAPTSEEVIESGSNFRRTLVFGNGLFNAPNLKQGGDDVIFANREACLSEKGSCYTSNTIGGENSLGVPQGTDVKS